MFVENRKTTLLHIFFLVMTLNYILVLQTPPKSFDDDKCVY